ncbi:hypothetical protein [Brumimicrobium mesophilum]|uniref:hypothetical protein n=1 Tax=Brumimicrobium mesophilum TaxID=392717 RepID=UPI000D140B42|nr:hypothetical protein [Brumimicrobium mesophilum]
MMKFKVFIGLNRIWIVIILFLFLFSSCAPQKRINRILKNNPHLLHRDTVKVTDTLTVITPAVEKDSLISVENLKKDTVYITEDNLIIKTYVRNDTLYVHGKCDTTINEIVREVLVPCETPIFHKPREKLSWFDYIDYVTSTLLVVIILILGLMYIFKK